MLPPTLMTVDWKHVLLDPLVYERHGTYRVARIPGGVTAFPVPEGASGRFRSPLRHWSPRTDGTAPEQYVHEGRRFDFRFWSVREFQNDRFVSGRSIDSNGFNVSYESGFIRVEATAFYYWDFGDGPGGHAVYVDAFDDHNQQFIPDDFVDVIPDDDTGSLTAEANNGRLGTEGIGKLVVRARNPTGDTIYVRYHFLYWVNQQDLGDEHPETIPVISGTDIRVRQGSVVSALAHYHPQVGASFPEVEPPREGGYIIGIPADGPIIFMPLGGGPPRPIGPWDPTLLTRFASLGQLGQLTAQLEDLRKRVAALEGKL